MINNSFITVHVSIVVLSRRYTIVLRGSVVDISVVEMETYWRMGSDRDRCNNVDYSVCDYVRLSFGCYANGVF
jgi:hypothetical protein